VLILSFGRIALGDLTYASRLQKYSLGSALGFGVAPKERTTTTFSDLLINVIDYIQMNTGQDDAVFAMSYFPVHHII